MSTRRIGILASRLCTAALLCAAPGALAQQIYRLVDAAGRVTFTDRPSAAHQVQEAAPDPARRSVISARRSAMIDASEATRRLERALLEHAQGAEPLPGERAGGAAGQALMQHYWRRQEKLSLMVEQARNRSDETRDALLARR